MDNLTQNSRLLQEKWAPVLNHEGLPEIKDQYKRAVTAVLLENQGRGGSKILHRIFNKGRKIFISKPINHFELNEKAKKTNIHF